MADRRIKLTWATSRFNLNQIDGIRVRMDIECAYDVTPNIFAYRNLPTDPKTGEKAAWFSHVCSPSDLEEFPNNAPIPGHLPEWFRLNYVDVFLRSRIEADAFIEDVRSDVRRLVSTLNIMDEIEPEGAEAVGGQLICASSSLSSASSSSSESSTSVGGPLSLTRWGSFEQGSGAGQEWIATGDGAGSPIGSSDSLSGSMPYSYSSVTLLPEMVSQMLLIQGFGFAIPGDAIVDGIEVTLRARWRDGFDSASSLSSVSPAECAQGGGVAWSHEGGPQLVFFKLYHPDAGPVGDERSNNISIYGPEWYQWAFGGASDLWNSGLTPEVINRGGFGVSLVAGNFTEDPQYIVDVDGAEMTIHYRNTYDA
jgi:hypothetical protein